LRKGRIQEIEGPSQRGASEIIAARLFSVGLAGFERLFGVESDLCILVREGCVQSIDGLY
jgi:hypothetical protein